MSSNYTLNKISDSAYNVIKDGKPEYELKRINGHWACTCSGYYYRGTCKHIEMLKGKVADSELSLENEVYTSGEIEKMKSAIEPIFEGVNHEYSGDYRRGLGIVQSGVIVVECGVADFKSLIGKLDKERFCVMIQDDNMARGFFDRVPTIFLRVDKGKMASTLLSTTGSAEENARLRSIAKVMGYRLVAEGLFDGSGKLIDTPTEKSIYEKLGERYKEPTER